MARSVWKMQLMKKPLIMKPKNASGRHSDVVSRSTESNRAKQLFLILLCTEDVSDPCHNSKAWLKDYSGLPREA